ncbi:SDR family oxidoreductase [Brachybacterium saurashtrense]|uniref:Short chain dehydrogenase n=1 Tax=Brachybacterium saurashtrense TaxID=556288 RepID=A0A345YQ02_9MICO|nr:SDR family oxidoreductase [Brachybacterium saurashtrense]AXK46004.1 short chain dehydrogenase [Brachybacterium saurashtrense]RRR23743.1 short chain dehydrogenase [Brachybacterium saurashtrense]
MTSPSAETATSTAAPSSAASRPAVLVTGANRGIGRATAELLAEDHHLLLAGRDEAALDALAAALPSARPVVADLTDHEALAAAVEGLELPHGLAGLVHAAGILVNGGVEELSVADWERNFAVNVTAVSELTRLLLPALRTARGTVVAVNSGSGYTSTGERGAYSASKFALRAWTDALRQEEAGHGVRVSSVHPGRVDTDMQHELRAAEQGQYEAEKYLRPASVAAAIAYALHAPAEAVISSLEIRPRAIG